MGRSLIHPGEHLAEQLEELGISAAALARQLQVPTNRVTEILKGRRSITGDTALRLGHFFGTSPEFWMNLQKLYDLRLAESKSGKTIKELPTLVKMKTKQCRDSSIASGIVTMPDVRFGKHREFFMSLLSLVGLKTQCHSRRSLPFHRRVRFLVGELREWIRARSMQFTIALLFCHLILTKSACLRIKADLP